MRIRVESIVDEFLHKVAERAPLFEQILASDTPYMNEHLPLASTLQQEITALHANYAMTLNQEEYEWTQNNLPPDFGTADGKHFFWAKIMIVKRSELSFKEDKPRELLAKVLAEVNRKCQGRVDWVKSGQSIIGAYGEALNPYNQWVRTLELHQEKWMSNWIGGSQYILPEGWTMALELQFREEINRVYKEKQASLM